MASVCSTSTTPDTDAITRLSHWMAITRAMFPKYKASDAPILNLADIPITDNLLKISADTDSRSDIQCCLNFLPFST